MKLLIFLLLLFVVFWYYRKKRFLSKKEKEKALRMEMKPCRSCGVFFPESEGCKIEKGNKELFFCSEKCLKEFVSQERA